MLFRSDWLVSHGMPDDGSVRRLQANYFVTYPGFQDNAADYRTLRHWLDTKGRSSYTEYLVSHPKFVISSPRHSLADQFTPPVAPLAVAQHIGADPVMRGFGWVGLPPFRVTVVWAVLAMVGLGVVAALDRARRRVCTVIFACGFIVIPHALAVFHGDVLELARHSVSVAVQARVVVSVATAIVIDWCAARLALSRVSDVDEPDASEPDAPSLSGAANTV